VDEVKGVLTILSNTSNAFVTNDVSVLLKAPRKRKLFLGRNCGDNQAINLEPDLPFPVRFENGVSKLFEDILDTGKILRLIINPSGLHSMSKDMTKWPEAYGLMIGLIAGHFSKYYEIETRSASPKLWSVSSPERNLPCGMTRSKAETVLGPAIGNFCRYYNTVSPEEINKLLEKNGIRRNMGTLITDKGIVIVANCLPHGVERVGFIRFQ